MPPLTEMQAGLHNTRIQGPQGIRYKEATSVVRIQNEDMPQDLRGNSCNSWIVFF